LATSIKLEDDLKSRIQQLAESRQRSAHWIMREAIREYVEREEARESFRQEALASWTAYQESGQHLTGKEARNWLKTWGTDEESEITPCHE
jgi:predicted transcriptional regulator